MQKDNPSAYRIHEITHPTSKLVPEKFNFFADCLDLINVKAGEYFPFEVETHLSLLSSLIYFIDAEIKNPENQHRGNTIKHVKYILKTHPLLKANDRLVKEHYQSILPHISNITSLTGQVQPCLLQIKSDLENIQAIISPSYIKNIVHKISVHIICGHALKFHKGDFDYCAKIIFSHFYLNGYSRKDIASFVNKVLSGKVKREENRMYAEGPLPLDLRDKLIAHNTSEAAFDQALFDEIESYYNTRDMKKQIEGFLNLALYKKYEYSFLFKVDGGYLWKDELEIGGLKLIDTQKFIEKNKKRTSLSRTMQFLNEPSMLVVYKAHGYSQSEALKQAVIELTEKLNRIGFLISKRLVLDTWGYMVPVEGDENDKFWVNEMLERGSLSEWDTDTVEERNKVVSIPLFNSFLINVENILAEAHFENDANKSLHEYAKFIEQLTKNCLANISNSNSGIPKDILAIAYLLLQTEKNNYKYDIRRWAFNVIINSRDTSESVTGLSKEYHEEIRLRRKLFSYPELIKRFKHEHSTYRIKAANKYKSSISDVEAFHYYVRFLLVLKKYRNIKEHMNASEAQMARKLKLPVNTLFRRILIVVIKEFSKSGNANNTPQEVLNAMIHSGQAKAISLGISI